MKLMEASSVVTGLNFGGVPGHHNDFPIKNLVIPFMVEECQSAYRKGHLLCMLVSCCQIFCMQ